MSRPSISLMGKWSSKALVKNHGPNIINWERNLSIHQHHLNYRMININQ
jgi:hypothetical protein